MPFTTGREKTGGRKAGKANRTPAEVRDTIIAALGPQLESLPQMLNELKAEKRADVMVKLLALVLPRIQSEGEDKHLTISFTPDKVPSWLDGSPIAPEPMRT